MARILVADDEPAIRLYVEEALLGEGHEVRTADCPANAFPLAERERFDLVVSDVNMPGIHGFAFRGLLRKMPGYEGIPFLFMSAADPVAELEIARSLGTDRLLLKPFGIGDLLRHVELFLGNARAERRKLPDGLPSMLDGIERQRDTGILTAVSAGVAKRFVFRQGQLVFALSNDPRDLIGQAMLRAGVITENDLRTALAAVADADGGRGGPGLAGALAAMRKLSSEQCEKTFLGKIRESVLDVFIWDAGEVEFLSGGVLDADAPFPVSIDLAAMAAEGARRRQRWNAIRPGLPAGSDTIRKVGEWPDSFPKNVGDQLLARQVERGLTFDELLLELRGQRYAVSVRLADLLRRGAVTAEPNAGFSGTLAEEPSIEELERARLELELEGRMAGGPASGPVPAESPSPAAVTTVAETRPDPAPLPAEGAAGPSGPVAAGDGDSAGDEICSMILTQGLLKMREGDLAAAREAFLDVLKLDPLHPLARRRLQEVETGLTTGARNRGLRPDIVVGLAVPVTSLMGRKIPPSDAFVLSRLSAGSMPVRDLVHVCPIPENEILGILERCIADSIVRRIG